MSKQAREIVTGLALSCGCASTFVHFIFAVQAGKVWPATFGATFTAIGAAALWMNHNRSVAP